MNATLISFKIAIYFLLLGFSTNCTCHEDAKRESVIENHFVANEADDDIEEEIDIEDE